MSETLTLQLGCHLEKYTTEHISRHVLAYFNIHIKINSMVAVFNYHTSTTVSLVHRGHFRVTKVISLTKDNHRGANYNMMTDVLHELKRLQGSKLNGQHPLCLNCIGLSLFV